MATPRPDDATAITIATGWNRDRMISPALAAEARRKIDTETARHNRDPMQRTEPPARSRGLGDTIAKITHATGIDRVVKAVAVNGCGCEKRRKWLNDVFPYGESK